MTNCPNCYAPRKSATSKFCNKCGSALPLVQAQQQTPAPVAPPAFPVAGAPVQSPNVAAAPGAASGLYKYFPSLQTWSQQKWFRVNSVIYAVLLFGIITPVGVAAYLGWVSFAGGLTFLLPTEQLLYGLLGAHTLAIVATCAYTLWYAKDADGSDPKEWLLAICAPLIVAIVLALAAVLIYVAVLIIGVIIAIKIWLGGGRRVVKKCNFCSHENPLYATTCQNCFRSL